MNRMLVWQWLRNAAIVACVAPSGVVAQPVEVSASTAELVTARDCIPGITACDDLSPIIFSAYGGLPGDVASGATIDPVGYGHSNGHVALSGEVGAPVISASVSSEAGKRLTTNSLALQRYVYNGSASTTRTFGGDRKSVV